MHDGRGTSLGIIVSVVLAIGGALAAAFGCRFGGGALATLFFKLSSFERKG